jgi:thiamine biosynthesis protein ThiI
MDWNAIIVRYGEVFLKGKNRGHFIGQLKKNIETLLKGVGEFRVKEVQGFLLVLPKADEKFGGVEGLKNRLSKAFGVSSFSFCRIVPREISALEKEVVQIAEKEILGKNSFKVQASRSDKEYPLNSIDLNKRLGEVIVKTTQCRVDLKNPDITLYCHIMHKQASLFLDVCKGPGGIPVGCSGRVLLLLSGGIDSPVAGYLAMKRGCVLDCVHFDAAPYTTAKTKEKVISLARMLAGYEGELRLFIVPFGAIQRQTKDSAPARLLVVLYRRMMFRIATQVANRCGALALVTGENLAQVASQTLENMRVIEEACDIPVLRPLLTYDKVETISLARKIGTYETSILPYEDCCSLFVPKHPETGAKLEAIQKVEKRLPIERMMEESVLLTEEMHVRPTDV